MLMDALSWEAVRFSDLKTGMPFERKLSSEERSSVSAMLGKIIPQETETDVI